MTTTRKKISFKKLDGNYEREKVIKGLDEYLRHEHRVSEYYRETITRQVEGFIKRYGTLKPSIELSYKIQDDLYERNPDTSIRTVTLYQYYLEYWAASMGIKLKIPNKASDVVQREDYLTLDEVRQYRAAYANIHDQIVCDMMLFAGLRVGLVVAANLEDLDLSRRLLKIKANTIGNKRKKADNILLEGKIYDIINEWLENRPAVDTNAICVNQYGERFTKDGVRQLVYRVGNRAGISRRVYPHLLRATFATHMSKAGASTQAVQRALLQSDPRSAMIYMRGAEEILKEKLRTFEY